MTKYVPLFAFILLPISAAAQIAPTAKPLSEEMAKEISKAIINKGAVDDISVQSGQKCPSSTQGTWITIKNQNAASRVFATLQIKGAPSSYPVLVDSLSNLTEVTPIIRGVLLLPGEQKNVGCSSQMISGTVSWVSYEYSIIGAYYPDPNLQFPSDPPAKQFVRFIEMPDNSAQSTYCASPNVATGYYIIRNSHPTRSIKARVAGVIGNTTTYSLSPEELNVAGCNTNHLILEDAQYLN